jgi:hypothetical protein
VVDREANRNFILREFLDLPLLGDHNNFDFFQRNGESNRLVLECSIYALGDNKIIHFSDFCVALSPRTSMRLAKCKV